MRIKKVSKSWSSLKYERQSKLQAWFYSIASLTETAKLEGGAQWLFTTQAAGAELGRKREGANHSASLHSLSCCLSTTTIIFWDFNNASNQWKNYYTVKHLSFLVRINCIARILQKNRMTGVQTTLASTTLSKSYGYAHFGHKCI